MAYDKPIIQTSDPYRKIGTEIPNSRTIHYGEVIEINDPTEGGRIKVRIPDLDNKIANDDLSWCYPLLPKFIHLYPKIGEMVRVFIEDAKYPQRSRYWIGSIISQPQKIGFDGIYTALSTTNRGVTSPDAATSTIPDAVGVYPRLTDIAIVGRVNTDIILRDNEVHLRAGKHENGNVLKLNIKNPATISLVFEPKPNSSTYYSSGIIMGDKIALITHNGNPQFKSNQLTSEDRERIFAEGHPMARADVLVEALKVFKEAIINHIHGYSTLPPDKTSIIKSLESLNLEAILQKDIVVN